MRGGLLTSFVWTFLGKFGQQGTSFVVGALLTRALGTAGRGFFAEAQTWVGMAIALCGFSLDTAIYHFANRERYPVADGVRVALTLAASVLAGLLGASLLCLAVWVRPDKISAEAASQLPLMFAAVITTLLATNLITLGQALGRVRLAATVTILQGVVNLALIVVAFVAHAIDLRLALVAVVVTQSIGVVTALASFLRSDGATFAGVNGGLLSSFLSAGLKLHVGTVAAFVYVRFNLLIVFQYCGADQAGLLATAWTLAFGLLGMLGSFQLALYPRVLHSSDDFVITVRSLRLGLYLGLLFIAPLLLAARWLLHYYGGEAFEAAAPTFRLLTLAAWVMFLSSLVAPYIIKSGALLIASGCAVLVGGVSVAANFLLVPRYQVEGAGVATLIAVVFNFGLSLGLLALLARKSPLGFMRPRFAPEWAAARGLFASASLFLRRAKA